MAAIRSTFVRTLISLTAATAAVVSFPGPALADSAPDAGRPFVVELNSEPLYGIKRPEVDPATQTVRLPVSDDPGAPELFLETFLPAPKDGNVPPEKVPTILIVTPYDLAIDVVNEKRPDEVGMASPLTLKALVPHGYAYSQLHVRGTGESTGCPNPGTQQEADDIALAIEYLATEAPWSNGIVGGYGHSNPGGSILNVATRAADRIAPYLKALWVGAPVVDRYNSSWILDGVAAQLWKPVGTPYYEVAPIVETNEDLARWAEREQCNTYDNKVHPWLQPTNDYSQYFRERDIRGSVEKLKTPIFMFHGHGDLYHSNGASPMNQVGFFERIPEATPAYGMFGVFGHDHPSEDLDRARTIRPEWARPDYDDMRIAWFDYWLKGIDTNIEDWPPVQVQGTDGQWRTEPNWPFTGGPVGHLALGPEETLGDSNPSGSTIYLEGTTETNLGRVPGTYAVFQTDVQERMQITAQPVLDLWVELASLDGHIAARLETFDANGDPIPHGMTYGTRSVQHLEPLVNNTFVQEQSVPAPLATPLNVPIRFMPTDLVVPAGGSLRITIAGSVKVSPGINMAAERCVEDVPLPGCLPDPLFGDWSQTSGSTAPVKILHDCEHPSALRFLMPREDPDLLNVREADETHVRANPGPAPISDGGIATDAVCGAAPLRLPNFGPESAYSTTGDGVTKPRR